MRSGLRDGRATIGALAMSLVASAILAACGSTSAPRAEEIVVVEIVAPLGRDLEIDDLSIEPRARVSWVRRTGVSIWSVGIAGGRHGTLRLTHPETCDAEVDLEEGARVTSAPTRVELASWIDLGGEQPQVGFATPFEIEARPGCREAIAGRVTWRVVDGSELDDVETTQNGFVFRAQTHPREVVYPAPLPWGLVPVPPRKRLRTTLEATWSGSGHDEVRRRIQVGALARQNGVPSVPPGQVLMLSDSGFSVKDAAPGGQAAVATHEDGTVTFTPDVQGAWTLVDAEGRELVIRVGRHDETRLDCGRAECHASVTARAATSPMTHILAREVRAEIGDPEADPSCALECHAVGEPGLADGGLVHVAWENGISPLARGPGQDHWAAMPRALRRLGGVGCTSCHGPGAIPSPSARWMILRRDVCAVCHDAPPRYGHVIALRASRMADSDEDPRTREEPCAGCHTTSGYLARIGARSGALRVDPPPHAGALGIACAACHAAHGDDTGHALLRSVPLAAYLGEVPSVETSGTCVSCHAPFEENGAPAASSAAILLGRGGFNAEGRALVGPSPHGTVVGGCVGCHHATAPELELERGSNHSFGVAEDTCGTCHAGGVPPDVSRELEERARAVLARLGLHVEHDREEPAHARRAVSLAEGPTRERDARAARNALLVLEDPAAASHNGAYARLLLDAAEAMLSP